MSTRYIGPFEFSNNDGIARAELRIETDDLVDATSVALVTINDYEEGDDLGSFELSREQALGLRNALEAIEKGE